MQKLNYNFADITYLQTALTHSSYSNEMKNKGYRAESNEALEFLGDSVLQIVISEELYNKYSKHGEGTLTKIRQNLVCEKTLAKIATKLSLGKYLNIGTAEENSGIRSREKVLADALEAVFAAIYIDDREYNQGKSFNDVVLGIFSEELINPLQLSEADFKTMLQQFVEKNNGSELKYKYVEYGPEHDKTFIANAYINNNLVGKGEGRTKRSAESSAAMEALKLFGIL